jgi:hypothetical protein
MERISENGHTPIGVARALPDELAKDLERARKQMGDFNRKALDFIKERPIPVLIGAFCVGLLLGRMANRR